MSLFVKNYKLQLEKLLTKAKDLELGLRDIRSLNIPKIETEIKEIEKEDFDIFELIVELYHYGKINKKLGEQIINHTKELFKKLREIEHLAKKGILKVENLRYLDSMLYGLESFLREEELYINKEPGMGSRGHIRLIEIILKKRLVFNNVDIEVRGNKIFVGSIGLRNVVLQGDTVRIIAEHYSTIETLNRITKTGQLVTGKWDPYGYAVIESHKLAALIKKAASETERAQMIQRVLGVKQKQIDGWIKLVIIAPIRDVWLKIKKGQPTHIAVEGKVVPVKPINFKKGFEVFYFE